jgi:hypothetical protein
MPPLEKEKKDAHRTASLALGIPARGPSAFENHPMIDTAASRRNQEPDWST